MSISELVPMLVQNGTLGNKTENAEEFPMKNV